MIKENMERIIEKRKKKYIEDDYGIQECWEEMTDILSVDICQTIEYLEKCTKEEAYYISEIIDDILVRVQNEAFIHCLRKLDKKFPELNIKKDIDMAEKYM